MAISQGLFVPVFPFVFANTAYIFGFSACIIKNVIIGEIDGYGCVVVTTS